MKEGFICWELYMFVVGLAAAAVFVLVLVYTDGVLLYL